MENIPIKSRLYRIDRCLSRATPALARCPLCRQRCSSGQSNSRISISTNHQLIRRPIGRMTSEISILLSARKSCEKSPGPQRRFVSESLRKPPESAQSATSASREKSSHRESCPAEELLVPKAALGIPDAGDYPRTRFPNWNSYLGTTAPTSSSASPARTRRGSVNWRLPWNQLGAPFSGSGAFPQARVGGHISARLWSRHAALWSSGPSTLSGPTSSFKKRTTELSESCSYRCSANPCGHHWDSGRSMQPISQVGRRGPPRSHSTCSSRI